MNSPTADLAYQMEMLQGVSRSFAFTTPQLPPPLCLAVGNAYLLCRIADTIEDEAALSVAQKHEFSQRWAGVVEGRENAGTFARDLGILLSTATTQSEHRLVCDTSRIVGITRTLSSAQQQALVCCVNIMTTGMSEFQQNASLKGLPDLKQFNRYCYHVAGVFGEMLTKLFCDYSEQIAARRETLFCLSASYGQGLQMTNILKDIWEDHSRGVCWLPQDVFHSVGFDLGSLSPGQADPEFVKGLNQLIAIAGYHLTNALQYICALPAQETGIRRYCLWSLGMAVLTLRRIYATPAFTSGQEVKVSRRAVRAIIISTSALARFNLALELLFAMLNRNLPGLDAATSVADLSIAQPESNRS